MAVSSAKNVSGLGSIKSEKSTDKIIRQVREGILKGHLKPGTFLGSEKDLSELFEVSKQTLRETINALEYMGLVVKKKGPGGGVFISQVSERMANDLLFTGINVFTNIEADRIAHFFFLGLNGNL